MKSFSKSPPPVQRDRRLPHLGYSPAPVFYQVWLMGHVPPTPDLYFHECVSRARSFLSPLCGHVVGDIDPNSLFYSVLSIHRNLAKVPGYDRWTPVRGELSSFAQQLQGKR